MIIGLNRSPIATQNKKNSTNILRLRKLKYKKSAKRQICCAKFLVKMAENFSLIKHRGKNGFSRTFCVFRGKEKFIAGKPYNSVAPAKGKEKYPAKLGKTVVEK